MPTFLSGEIVDCQILQYIASTHVHAVTIVAEWHARLFICITILIVMIKTRIVEYVGASGIFAPVTSGYILGCGS